MNAIYRTKSTDPWENLAVEEYLLDTITAPTLYLWQNERTVVIGRHQNVWAECDLSALESFNGRLARRLSGGGAVYHDLGNLNFTFLLPRPLYDQTRQTSVLLQAALDVGIHAEATGRNDLLADGRKFSGHAFCFREHTAYHHGTLLLDTDIERMTRVLTVDASKLASKAIASVRSRVVNLRELAPALTAETLGEAVCRAFCHEYGDAKTYDTESLPRGEIARLREKYASWAWRFGETPTFDARMKTRFPWGGVEVCLTLRDAKVTCATVYTDALDTDFAGRLERTLCGLPYDAASFAQACCGQENALTECGLWLAEQMQG
ncbi:MAG: lipoate--protein ligase [Clostridiaceae bacterium]|nr:lipoate--protein ligase [Clostridiaceae bacterium]